MGAPRPPDPTDLALGVPGGTLEEGETAEQAAVRECVAGDRPCRGRGHEIGQRTHPVTGQVLIYIACTPTTGPDACAVAPDEFVEVRWLNRKRVEELMPDLAPRRRLTTCSQKRCVGAGERRATMNDRTPMAM